MHIHEIHNIALTFQVCAYIYILDAKRLSLNFIKILTIMQIKSVDFLKKACSFSIVGKQLLNTLMLIAKIGPPPPNTIVVRGWLMNWAFE